MKPIEDHLTDHEIEWSKLSPYRQQLLNAFGYSHPDDTCPDWENNSLFPEFLTYKHMGCCCCDNLDSDVHPALRNKKISLSCAKGHVLVVAVLKED